MPKAAVRVGVAAKNTFNEDETICDGRKEEIALALANRDSQQLAQAVRPPWKRINWNVVVDQGAPADRIFIRVGLIWKSLLPSYLPDQIPPTYTIDCPIQLQAVLSRPNGVAGSHCLINGMDELPPGVSRETWVVKVFQENGIKI